MVSPSEKLVSVRDAICRLLVLAVFCSLGESWVCGVQQDESGGKMRAKVVRPIPLLSLGIKSVPS